MKLTQSRNDDISKKASRESPGIEYVINHDKTFNAPMIVTNPATRRTSRGEVCSTIQIFDKSTCAHIMNVHKYADAKHKLK